MFYDLGILVGEVSCFVWIGEQVEELGCSRAGGMHERVSAQDAFVGYQQFETSFDSPTIEQARNWVVDISDVMSESLAKDHITDLRLTIDDYAK